MSVYHELAIVRLAIRYCRWRSSAIHRLSQAGISNALPQVDGKQAELFP
ncbi:MAG: hypothetical protein M1343_04995 [Chloroflexi bacterium]|nr:hypothetical protein [Chloroflexota bacterium]